MAAPLLFYSVNDFGESFANATHEQLLSALERSSKLLGIPEKEAEVKYRRINSFRARDGPPALEELIRENKGREGIGLVVCDVNVGQDKDGLLRRIIAAETRDGYRVVSPDNGTIRHLGPVNAVEVDYELMNYLSGVEAGGAVWQAGIAMSIAAALWGATNSIDSLGKRINPESLRSFEEHESIIRDAVEKYKGETLKDTLKSFEKKLKTTEARGLYRAEEGKQDHNGNYVLNLKWRDVPNRENLAGVSLWDSNKRALAYFPLKSMYLPESKGRGSRFGVVVSPYFGEKAPVSLRTGKKVLDDPWLELYVFMGDIREEFEKSGISIDDCWYALHYHPEGKMPGFLSDLEKRRRRDWKKEQEHKLYSIRNTLVLKKQ